MGIREEIQADLAEAFDTDLADAIQLFTGGVTLPGTWDPVTEESTGEVVVAYSGRRRLLGSWSFRWLQNCHGGRDQHQVYRPVTYLPDQ